MSQSNVQYVQGPWKPGNGLYWYFPASQHDDNVDIFQIHDLMMVEGGPAVAGAAAVAKSEGEAVVDMRTEINGGKKDGVVVVSVCLNLY